MTSETRLGWKRPIRRPQYERLDWALSFITCVFFPQMYLVIFPEGTRYNPELKNVIADSQAFAAKEGTVMAAAVRCSSAAY